MYEYLMRKLPDDYNLLIVDMQEEVRCVCDPGDIADKTTFVKGIANSRKGLGNSVLIEMCDEESPIGPPFIELNSLVENCPIFKKYSFDAFSYRGTDKLDDYLVGNIPTAIVGNTAMQCVLETGLGAKKFGFNPIVLLEGVMKPDSEDVWKKYIDNELPIYISPESQVPPILRI